MSDRGIEGSSGIGVDGLTPSAGAMLKAAREKRGVHVAALAASLKVPQRKLEALEADRYDELPDLTFTRALAQSVCRSLKIDAQPVLDRLPQGAVSRKLEHVSTGLKAPFRERPGREEPADWSWVRRPVVWGTALVLVGAAAVALLPDHWLNRAGRGRAPVAASAPVDQGIGTMALPAVAAPAASAVDVVPAVGNPVASPASAPTTLAGALVVTVSAESWVEVQDGRGLTLLSRSVTAGETVALDAAPPLRLIIGNASATQVTFRGRTVDLTAHTTGNVARMQLD